MEREICTLLKLPELASFRTVTPKEKRLAGFARHVLTASPQFERRLVFREGREAWISHHNHRGLQHPRVLKEVLKEADLAWCPFELTPLKRLWSSWRSDPKIMPSPMWDKIIPHCIFQLSRHLLDITNPS